MRPTWTRHPTEPGIGKLSWGRLNVVLVWHRNLAVHIGTRARGGHIAFGPPWEWPNIATTRDGRRRVAFALVSVSWWPTGEAP